MNYKVTVNGNKIEYGINEPKKVVIPKFRAWLKAEKQMIDVEFLDLSHKVLIGKHWEFGMTEAIKFDDVNLMQSTGLKDKNGVEIFEGDVVLENGWRKVAVSFGTQEIEENFGDKRIFQGFNLYLGGGYPEAVMSKHEIIGNIYDNPELLEE
ncbi:YopX family protein [Streptococcus sp. S784/96/1]|uniref:YopX family protein n=1 Tax=Streptococcus sp. S784/96/1 TaxID=2653499 RepID=UPI00192E66B7|nr:YopX family protein [Streptococcus sp. S784/96/1]